jgi:hypothetical protein
LYPRARLFSHRRRRSSRLLGLRARWFSRRSNSNLLVLLRGRMDKILNFRTLGHRILGCKTRE